MTQPCVYLRPQPTHTTCDARIFASAWPCVVDLMGTALESVSEAYNVVVFFQRPIAATAQALLAVRLESLPVFQSP
jgi:hypothetical protein